MSSIDPQRQTIEAIRDGFFTGWKQGNWSALSDSFAHDARLLSNQHPDVAGPDALIAALVAEAQVMTHLRTSNHYVGVAGDRAMASCYAIVELEHERAHVLFGSTVVLELQRQEGRWKLTCVRLSVNWFKGEPRVVSHWRGPPSDAGWALGDQPPVLVSELDSPWARLGAAFPESPSLAVTELYSKYSWAIDQGDIALLSDCFTEDAAGGFSPMGALRGRHSIIGQLKSFRRHWPWMQHFADVVRVQVDADGRHADMIVARIVPGRETELDGQLIYGAHYQIRARLEGDRKWRICWTDYRPGWFTKFSPPAFDIGTTSA